MPTYVYKFIETGETIEVQQSFQDDALTEAVHPTSGATMAVKKVFLPVGVTFKGDGFYKTDSRAAQKKSGAGAKESKDGAAKDAPSKETSSKDTSSKDTSKSSEGSSSGGSRESSGSSSSTASPAGSSKSD